MTKCYKCAREFEKVNKHISDAHPEEIAKQEVLILKYHTEGKSAKSIAAMPDIFMSATAITRVFRKNFSKEELEEKRKSTIGKTLKVKYDSGELDYVKDILTGVVQSEETRKKNSESVKKAYAEGRLQPWSKGLTKETSLKKKEAGDKTSITMKEKVKNGELKTLLKLGKDNIFWVEDRSQVSRYWRNGLDFSKNDRLSLFKKYNSRCAKCGISDSILEIEKDLLESNKLGLECDHIVPIKKHGSKDWETNGQLLCSRCHMIKTFRDQDFDIDLVNERILNKAKSSIQVMNKIYKDSALLPDRIGLQLNDLNIFVLPLEEEINEQYTIDALNEGLDNNLFFYYDEWVTQREICLSMIGYRNKETNNVVFARKCKVIQLTTIQSKQFCDENHISGGLINSTLSLGLVDEDNEILSVITFRKPFTKDKNGIIEISRFCSKINYSIPGGFQKLLKHSMPLLKNSGYSQILTYADLRFGEGKVYEKSGFTLKSKATGNYYYTDGSKRYNRFKFRAQDGLTEAEYARKHGVWKIYGAGNNVYYMSI